MFKTRCLNQNYLYFWPMSVNKPNPNIDFSKLIKVAQYAKMKGKTRQRIYQMGEEGLIKIIDFQGTKYVQMP